MTQDTRSPVLEEPEEIAASGAPVIEPWRRVVLDPEFGGCWVIAGDVDGDGVPGLMLTTESAAYIFRNEGGPTSGAPLGSGTNHTFY